MKCSKHFATENGQSHLPSNMIHVPEALASNSKTVDGTPLIMLTLTRRTTTKPTELRIRMTVDEARRLVADIQSRIDNAQPVISIPAGDSLVLDEAQRFLERHAAQGITTIPAGTVIDVPHAEDAGWAGCCRASRRIWELFNAMQKGTPEDLKLAPTSTTAEMIAAELGILTPSDEEQPRQFTGYGSDGFDINALPTSATVIPAQHDHERLSDKLSIKTAQGYEYHVRQENAATLFTAWRAWVEAQQECIAQPDQWNAVIGAADVYLHGRPDAYQSDSVTDVSAI